MSEFEEIQITFNRRNPILTRIAIDGQPVINVYAIRLEQTRPDKFLTLELRTYGEPVLHTEQEWIVNAVCVNCKQATGGFNERYRPLGTESQDDRSPTTS